MKDEFMKIVFRELSMHPMLVQCASLPARREGGPKDRVGQNNPKITL